MNKAAIFHRPSREYIMPIASNVLTFRLLCEREDFAKASLIYWKRGKKEETSIIEMKLYCRTALRDDFRIDITFSERAHYIQYYFCLETLNNEKLYFSLEELSENEEPKKGWFEHPWTNYNEIFKVPEWAKGLSYYQIFPDRFSNNNNNNSIKFSPWNSKPTRDNFMGGNLKGIIEHLGYLKDLGIEAIYLCPIFKAKFNHKYATIDYFKIDSLFGEKEDLVELVSKCHSRGIKVILDGVFNHVSTEFIKFQKFEEDNKNEDWFFPLSKASSISQAKYECVGDYAPMPKLKTSTPEVRSYIYSIMKYWIDCAGIDGWRLDVADEIDISTWQYIRLKIKKSYPNVLLLGENWGDGIRNVGFGDQLDCVMNYQLRSAVLDLFATSIIDCITFVDRINKVLSCYHEIVNQCNYNLLSSHDIPRFLTICKEDIRVFSLATCFQMTFIGSPALFYGDENGLVGESDPDCRKCMNFTGSDQLHSLIKSLLKLRTKYIALKKGQFVNMEEYCTSTTFGFAREYSNQRIEIIFNLGKERIEIENSNMTIFNFPENRDLKSRFIEPLSMKILNGGKNED